ncbi:hypothetical protein SKAU_G00197290 [Synaphobranchus kaupii]|uniref:Uncharacterized protein n=1 Tax=Synaphobranchus kaupii TaxID=118154 RepID=A0A9Q1IY15_SYNKA|nr:hypothetical protein SKAU_G00197290 [Synaphobranchus kaupii]
MAFGRAPDTPAVPPGPEYARRLQDRLETAHAFTCKQMENAGVRQKRNFDVRMRGRHFQAEKQPGTGCRGPCGAGGGPTPTSRFPQTPAAPGSL